MIRYAFSSLFLIISYFLSRPPALISSVITIQSPCSHVFETLRRVDEYVNWNPSRTGQGYLAKGDTVDWILRNGMPDSAIVVAASDHYLEWSGGIWPLVHGSHYFKVLENGIEWCRIEQGEALDGFVPRLFLKMEFTRSFVRKDLDTVNTALSNYILKVEGLTS